MHEGPTENRLGELGSLYKYKNIIIIIIIIIIKYISPDKGLYMSFYRWNWWRYQSPN